MPATVVVGLQWGDEGKAKVLDELSARADIVCRYQGGANAGHTVVVDGEKYKFHLVPCGVARPGKPCYVGNGVALDPAALLEEIRHFEGRGLEVRDRLVISNRAHVVMPYHKAVEALAEKALGDAKIGTTLRGIGPCYADKYSRTGFRMADVVRDGFAERAKARLEGVNAIVEGVYGEKPLTFEEAVAPAIEAARELAPMVGDVSELLNDALEAGREILFEGAQATLLDIDFGTYPFVTSSSASALGVPAGAGVAPWRIGHIVGLLKAYTTRVGAGPFPTEADDDAGPRLREKGAEFGTTTGRPRRCGWFDAVASRYAVRLNGVHEVAVSKLDVLSGEPVVKIATAYRLPDGSTTKLFPATLDDLAAVEPVYEEHEGWTEPLGDAREPADLPDAARRYVERLTELAGVGAALVSVGEDRGATIRWKS
ncbi:MAG: adenylosuccinate synthase [Planctomycetota bacterium]